MSYDAEFHRLSDDIRLLSTFSNNGGDTGKNLNTRKIKFVMRKFVTGRGCVIAKTRTGESVNTLMLKLPD